MLMLKYRRGAELPPASLHWQEETAPGVFEDLDLSGYTFVATILSGSTVVVTKVTGITASGATATIAWAAGELDLAPGLYTLHLRASSGGLDRDYSPADPVQLLIRP